MFRIIVIEFTIQAYMNLILYNYQDSQNEKSGTVETECSLACDVLCRLTLTHRDRIITAAKT
jgi:hypothetical protein